MPGGGIIALSRTVEYNVRSTWDRWVCTRAAHNASCNLPNLDLMETLGQSNSISTDAYALAHPSYMHLQAYSAAVASAKADVSNDDAISQALDSDVNGAGR